MKEIPFRWIDRYLIHLKIQEKFLLLLILPIIALISVSLVFNNAAERMLHNQYNTEYQLVKNLINDGYVSQKQIDTILTSLGENTSSNTKSTLLLENKNSLLSSLNIAEMIIIFSVLFIMTMSVYYIMTFIGGAMFTMNKALKTLADGDLTERMNFFKVRDEFSDIAITIDKVAEREQNMVLSIQKSITLMQSISADLSQSNQRSHEISGVQQEHLNSLASATEEMVATIRDVANLAQDSSAQTVQAHTVAAEGQTKVVRTLDSISNLSFEIQSASDAVSQLESNTAQIDDIVATIRGISEQTNLLALNAAIEAARAGEQGRGFAVVADEVRALASRTQQATGEIQSMIEAVQKNSRSLTHLMEKTVSNASTGKQKMSEVDVEFGTLTKKNQRISDSSIQIATAAEQQGVVAVNIAESVEEVRNQATNVHNMISENTLTISKLTNQSNQLEKLLDGIRA